MNIEKLTAEDKILINIVKRRITKIENIKSHCLRDFLQALDDFEIKTRCYLGHI